MKRRLSIIISIIVLLGIIIGFTIALFRKVVYTQDVNFTLSGITVTYSAGPDITGAKLFPATTLQKGLTDGIAIEKQITVSSSKTAYFSLYMDVEILDNGLKRDYVKYQINKGNIKISSGNLVSVNAGDTIILLNAEEINSTTATYTLYIWIDGSVDNDEYVENQNYKFVLHANAFENDPRLDKSGANAPALVDGLIPVRYDATSGWVKADSANTDINNQWYDYDSKKWANAVLVSSTNRSTYMSADAGTPIPESDVLAYYVWIPRYKYKVWNINKVIGVDSYNAEENGIDIVFEKGTSSTGAITCSNYDFTITNGSLSEICSGSNGDYYTHPAFTFGNDELTGIWESKFAISSSDPGVSIGGGNSTEYDVMVKPNVPSWRANTIDNYFKVIRDMQKENNIYGLSSNETVLNTHMIKNIEWGAMAYLTYSKYGICDNSGCDEVYKNNSNTYITGNSGEEAFAPGRMGTTLAYNENKKTTTVTGGTAVATTMTNDATYPWVNNNGIWSSGNAQVRNSNSTLTYNFTNASDAVMKLEFSVSSYYSLFLNIYLDGTLIMRASDLNRGTEEATLKYDTFLYNVSSGSHILSITFENHTNFSGLNKAYVKSFEVLQGATINVTHSDELGGQLASSTHNETGIYDMNGASWKYVMGNVSSTQGSYVYNPANVGNNFTYGNDTLKYIDRYAYVTTSTDQAAYNHAILGDATGEVAKTGGYSWKNDGANFSVSTSPWFFRGPAWYHTSYGGIFYYHIGPISNGDGHSMVSTFASLAVY